MSTQPTPRDVSFVRSLFALNPSSRPYRYGLMVGICMAFPAFVGTLMGSFQQGLMAVMGSAIILYLPTSGIAQRMLTLAACTCGFAFCFFLGLWGSVHPLVSAAVLAVTAFLVSLVAGYFRIAPPGNFFFIMLAAIATVVPHEPAAIPERIGLLVMGSMATCLFAFVYSLLFPAPVAAADLQPLSQNGIRTLVLHSALMGIFVGGGYWFAHGIGMHNPYWVPISCAAIMQGANLRMVWLRKIHRIAGTAVGMVLAFLLFKLIDGPWMLTAAIVILSFVIEMLIPRNYGYAVIFITPLTVIFAGVASHGLEMNELVFTRLLDISLGSVIGALGGVFAHWLVPRMTTVLKQRSARH